MTNSNSSKASLHASSSDNDDDVLASSGVSDVMDMVMPYVYYIVRFILALAVVWFTSGATK